MPGKRAEDVKLHNIGVENELWDSAMTKATKEGVSLSEVVRRKLREYVAEK